MEHRGVETKGKVRRAHLDVLVTEDCIVDQRGAPVNASAVTTNVCDVLGGASTPLAALHLLERTTALPSSERLATDADPLAQPPERSWTRH